MALPFTSHMKDEILVEYTGVDIDLECQYKITSTPHVDAFADIGGKRKKKKYLFLDADLKAFKKLGYAVCHNKLDEFGKKVYIHHNIRTFKEKKQ